MIKKIIAFSARNKFLIILLTIAAMGGAFYCLKNIPLDALPDMSDTQVIIYSRWDRSPDIIEDQVTYPLVSGLTGAPGVKAVRGFSDFGFSYIYVIFADGTDIYWARSRVNEYLGKIQPRLPAGVKTEMGPDATSLGWIFQYALVDRSGQSDSAKLRSFQDWYLRYWLQGVQGVAEVASIGGYQKQYQININPNLLAGYGIPITNVISAVRANNNDTGGRLLELGGTEYMVRGRGYLKSVDDIGAISVGTDGHGTPILIRNIAEVTMGPDIRRGASDLDGQGDTVGGIVIMRSGENALNVIKRVKTRLQELKSSLPPGVELVITYDRSDLILRAIETLKHQLIEEMIIISLVILFFLWHFPSAIVPIITIPVAVLLSFIPLFGLNLTTNIMSLAGIAISIGVLVDGAIVEVENAYRRLQEWEAGGRVGDFHAVRLQALQEVGPAVFFSLLVIGAAFLPIFTLVDQEGRLFKPLAYSKNLAMVIAAILAITLDPAMRMLFTRMDYVSFRPRWLSKIFNTLTVGRYYPEEKHPVSRVLHKIYEPVCRWVLRFPKSTIAGAVVLILLTIPVYLQLGTEFMPPLNEGSILYMPVTMPGIAINEAQKLLQIMDQQIMTVPEVERVFGKAGRADTATDPAPLSMFENTIILKPVEQWRKVPRWYSALPAFVHPIFDPFWPEHVSWEDIVAELNSKLQLPGVSNAWTMPIKARIDMLSTGIRTPIGIKIFGSDLQKIEQIGVQIETLLRKVPEVRSVYAERIASGYFIDFDIHREQLARYGLTVEDVEMIIAAAIGGEPITTTIEGRERYSVNVRYAREYRDDVEKLRRVLVPIASGTVVPISELADIAIRTGPSMIRDENGMLSGYVYVDTASTDIGRFVDKTRKLVDTQISLPAGMALQWSGQFENMLRVKARLMVVIPLTVFIIILLLYANTRSLIKTGIVLLAVPFSLVGAVWLLWLLHYNISIAVWVGMIALMGLDAETGVFMLLYLDLAYEKRKADGLLKSRADLEDAIVEGAVKRLRPKLMTVTAMFMGLLPIMWSMGAGADVMKRIATPMIGGIFTSFCLELLVYPTVYFIWKYRVFRKAL